MKCLRYCFQGTPDVASVRRNSVCQDLGHGKELTNLAVSDLNAPARHVYEGNQQALQATVTDICSSLASLDCASWLERIIGSLETVEGGMAVVTSLVIFSSEASGGWLFGNSTLNRRGHSWLVALYERLSRKLADAYVVIQADWQDAGTPLPHPVVRIRPPPLRLAPGEWLALPIDQRGGCLVAALLLTCQEPSPFPAFPPSHSLSPSQKSVQLMTASCAVDPRVADQKPGWSRELLHKPRGQDKQRVPMSRKELDMKPGNDADRGCKMRPSMSDLGPDGISELRRLAQFLGYGLFSDSTHARLLSQVAGHLGVMTSSHSLHDLVCAVLEAVQDFLYGKLALPAQPLLVATTAPVLAAGNAGIGSPVVAFSWRQHRDAAGAAAAATTNSTTPTTQTGLRNADPHVLCFPAPSPYASPGPSSSFAAVATALGSPVGPNPPLSSTMSSAAAGAGRPSNAAGPFGSHVTGPDSGPMQRMQRASSVASLRLAPGTGVGGEADGMTAPGAGGLCGKGGGGGGGGAAEPSRIKAVKTSLQRTLLLKALRAAVPSAGSLGVETTAPAPHLATDGSGQRCRSSDGTLAVAAPATGEFSYTTLNAAGAAVVPPPLPPSLRGLASASALHGGRGPVTAVVLSDASAHVLDEQQTYRDVLLAGNLLGGISPGSILVCVEGPETAAASSLGGGGAATGSGLHPHPHHHMQRQQQSAAGAIPSGSSGLPSSSTRNPTGTSVCTETGTGTGMAPGTGSGTAMRALMSTLTDSGGSVSTSRPAVEEDPAGAWSQSTALQNGTAAAAMAASLLSGPGAATATGFAAAGIATGAAASAAAAGACIPITAPPPVQLGVYLVFSESVPTAVLNMVALELQPLMALLFSTFRAALDGAAASSPYGNGSRLSADWRALYEQLTGKTLGGPAGTGGGGGSGPNSGVGSMAGAGGIPGGPHAAAAGLLMKMHSGLDTVSENSSTDLASPVGARAGPGHGMLAHAALARSASGLPSCNSAGAAAAAAAGFASGLGASAAGSSHLNPLARALSGGGKVSVRQLAGMQQGRLGPLASVLGGGGGASAGVYGGGGILETAPTELLHDGCSGACALPGASHGGQCRFASGSWLVNSSPEVRLEDLAGPGGAATTAGQLPTELLVSTMRTRLSAAIAVQEGSEAARATLNQDLAAVELLEVLGRGGQGVVFRGTMHGLETAVKVLVQQPNPTTANKGSVAAQQNNNNNNDNSPKDNQQQRDKKNPDGELQQQQQQQGCGGDVDARGPVAAAAGGGDAAAGADAEAGREEGDGGVSREVADTMCRMVKRGAMEVAVATTLSHPNIVQVYAAFSEVVVVRCHYRDNPVSLLRLCAVDDPILNGNQPGPLNQVLCLEYCDAGTLAAAARAGAFRQPCATGCNNGSIWPSLVPLYTSLLEVALALRHVHARQLVHCDVKAANVLLKSSTRDPRGWSCKLSDFGCVRLAVEVGEDGRQGFRVTHPLGTVGYMAPECFVRGSLLGTEVDIYAFGVLMWELLMCRTPYSNINPQEVPRQVLRNSLRPVFHPLAPAPYCSLAARCWSTSARRRPSAADLVTQLEQLLADSQPPISTKPPATCNLAPQLQPSSRPQPQPPAQPQAHIQARPQPLPPPPLQPAAQAPQQLPQPPQSQQTSGRQAPRPLVPSPAPVPPAVRLAAATLSSSSSVATPSVSKPGGVGGAGTASAAAVPSPLQAPEPPARIQEGQHVSRMFASPGADEGGRWEWSSVCGLGGQRGNGGHGPGPGMSPVLERTDEPEVALAQQGPSQVRILARPQPRLGALAQELAAQYRR